MQLGPNFVYMIPTTTSFPSKNLMLVVVELRVYSGKTILSVLNDSQDSAFRAGNGLYRVEPQDSRPEMGKS